MEKNDLVVLEQKDMMSKAMQENMSFNGYNESTCLREAVNAYYERIGTKLGKPGKTTTKSSLILSRYLYLLQTS